MRPYLAIVADSFSEALKSKVLYGLLLVWSLVLAGLAPLGLVRDEHNRFDSETIVNRDRLTTLLAGAGQLPPTESRRRVWDAMEASTRREILERASNDTLDEIRTGVLAAGLNGALTNPDLYLAEAWPTAQRRDDLAALLSRNTGDLDETEIERLNRRLIELAFPGSFRAGQTQAIWIGYAGYKLGDPLVVSPDRVRSFIAGSILPGVLQLSLGIIGVFVAIVVTAHHVPDMFSSGMLPLLLSKPISRSGLLIAKFFGGVAFIALNIVFLLTGLYFVLGWRLAIWEPAIFWCAPIFVFVFMVYYSVSMLAGLIWKNATVAIVAVAAFFGLCFALGSLQAITSRLVEDERQIRSLTIAGDVLVGVSSFGELYIWDAASSRWQLVGESSDFPHRVLGPIHRAVDEELVFSQPGYHPLFGLRESDTDLYRLTLEQSRRDNPPDSAAGITDRIVQSALWDELRLDRVGSLPHKTQQLLSWNGEMYAIGNQGVYRRQRTAAGGAAGALASLGQIFGMGASSTDDFQQLSSPETTWESPLNASIDAEGRLAVYADGRLYRYRLGSDAFEAIGSPLELDVPRGTLAVLASNHAGVLIFTDQRLALRCRWDRDMVEKFDTGDKADLRPQAIVPAADETHWIIDADQRLWRLASDLTLLERIEPDREVYAVAVGPADEMVMVERGNQIVYRDVDSGAIRLASPPGMDSLAWWHYRIVRPIYALNPKPLAVQGLLRKVLRRDDPLAFGRGTQELQSLRLADDIWQPLISNGLFIVFTVVLACWLLHRQDVG